MIRLAPSILAADAADFAAAVEACEQGGADLIHVDVMDGHFVPNLTFGVPLVRALSGRTQVPLDLHLMVSNPARLLDEYLGAGAARVAVHWEADPHLDGTLARIRHEDAAAGVALNPATPVEVLHDALPRLDFVLIMSVNPGFSGQHFLPHALDKVRRLKTMIQDRELHVEIQIDGGIDADNIGAAATAGVEIAVAGSAVFGAAEPAAAIAELRSRAGVAA